jgi:formylglycine-generating enzyme required for sulfatase activity/serine/threonine protein kinase
VYKAYDNDTDEWMAIKVAELKVIDGKEYSLITEYEATKAVALHRNIANYKAVHQFVESNGVFDYAVMQYYPEGNLKQLSAREPLSAAEKKDIAEGIIRGVHHLHRHGILHRDLKPSNILISKTPRGRFIPKIADFGLAKFIDADKDQALSNSFVGGTLEYASPEQLFGKPLKANADLWSVGVLLFELFTGELPFSAADVTGSAEAKRAEIYKQIIKAEIPASIDICPPPYRAMIEVCLVKDVDYRVRRSGELVEMLKIKEPKITITIPVTDAKSNANLDGETILISNNTQRYQELLVEAEQSLLDDDYDRSIEKYNLALTLQADPREAVQGLKKATEAKRAFEVEVENQAAYDQLVQQASEAAQEEHYTEAVHLLAKALSILPDRKAEVDVLVDQYYAADDKKKQDAKIQQLRKQADEAYLDERWSDAVAYYQQAIDAGLDHGAIADKIDRAEQEVREQERELARKANYEEAIAKLQQALAADDMSGAEEGLKLVQQYALSPTEYSDLQVQTLTRQAYHQWVRKGDSAAEQGNLAAAIDAYEKAAAIDNSASGRLEDIRSKHLAELASAKEYGRLLNLLRDAVNKGDLDTAQVLADDVRDLDRLDEQGERVLAELADAVEQQAVAKRLLAEQSQLINAASAAEDKGDIDEALKLATQAATLDTDHQDKAAELVDRLRGALNEKVAAEKAAKALQADYQGSRTQVSQLIEAGDLKEARKVLDGLRSHTLADGTLDELDRKWADKFNSDLVVEARALVTQRKLSAAVDLIDRQRDQSFIAATTSKYLTALEEAAMLIDAAAKERSAQELKDAIDSLSQARRLVPELAYLEEDIATLQEEQRDQIRSEAEKQKREEAKRQAEEQTKKDTAKLKTLLAKNDFSGANDLLASLRGRLKAEAHLSEAKGFATAVMSFYRPLIDKAIGDSDYTEAAKGLKEVEGLLSDNKEFIQMRDRLDQAIAKSEAIAQEEAQRQKAKEAEEAKRRQKEEEEERARKAEQQRQEEAAAQAKIERQRAKEAEEAKRRQKEQEEERARKAEQQRKEEAAAQAKAEKQKAKEAQEAKRRQKEKDEKLARKAEQQRKQEAANLAKQRKEEKLKKQEEERVRKLEEKAKAEKEKALKKQEQQRQVAQAYAFVDQEKWSKAKKALQVAIAADPANSALQEKLQFVIQRIEEEKSKRRPLALYLTSGVGLVLVLSAIGWWAMRGGETASGSATADLGVSEVVVNEPTDIGSSDIDRLLSSEDEAELRDFVEINPTHPRLDEVERRLGIITDRRDDEAFGVARSANTIASFEAYKRTYPNGRHVKDADDRIAEISARVAKVANDGEAFELLKENPSMTAIQQFRKQFPESKFLSKVDKLESEIEAQNRQNDYQQALALSGVTGLRDFLDRYSTGPEVRLARAELDKRAAQAEKDLWIEVSESGQASDLQRYIDRYPQGAFISQAREQLKAAGEDGLWQQLRQRPTLAQANLYLSTYPSGKYVAEVRKLLLSLTDERDWEVAKAANTTEAYEKYVEEHGDGTYIDQARQRIEDLKPAETALPPLVKTVEDDLAVIAAGSFTLGCDGNDTKCEKDEMPPRDIRMKGIAVAKYEVTQRLWKKVMGSNPSYYAAKGKERCLSCPVENVTYDEVQRFIMTLNQVPSNPYTYRLPTEAEWEYAASGGRSTMFAGSDSADDVAVYNHMSGTVKVGSKRPNGFGLYDMSGNVAEWTSTWYSEDAYQDGQALNGPSNGETKVIRGGSFRDKSARCRVNNRNEMYPDEKEASVGFRIVRSL